MNREKVFHELATVLHDKLDEAMARFWEDNAFGCYSADTLLDRMTDAAINVLRMAAEHEDWLRAEDHLKD